MEAPLFVEFAATTFQSGRERSRSLPLCGTRLDHDFREVPVVNCHLELKPQEPPLNHGDSCNRFQPGPDKPLLATSAAIDRYGHETIIACLALLQRKAKEHQGIDYLQVFESPNGDRLWFIEDGEGGAITAMLPEDY